MGHFITLLLGVLVALILVGFFADKRASNGDPAVTPGLSLLPGDIKYESPSGNVKVYFPLMTSIVVSIVLSLMLWLFS